jgi:hypothetical protein
MAFEVSDLINLGFAWLFVCIAMGGYFFVWRKTGEKISSWVLLAAGWVLLAVLNTLVTVGLTKNIPLSITLSLTSYILVMVSVTLLFLRLTRVIKNAKTQAFNCIDSQNNSSTNG